MTRMIIDSEAELPSVAAVIVPLLGEFRIVCFHGDMGAGKTTLIKVICTLLGVEDAMSSPTFSIVNEYRDAQHQPVYHFDFYRIESLREALDIGTEEYFYSGDICLIEWPERINELMPEKHLEINIKLAGDIGREITISTNG